MSDSIQVYVGVLIGPHGQKTGRWVDYNEFHNFRMNVEMQLRAAGLPVVLPTEYGAVLSSSQWMQVVQEQNQQLNQLTGMVDNQSEAQQGPQPPQEP